LSCFKIVGFSPYASLIMPVHTRQSQYFQRTGEPTKLSLSMVDLDPLGLLDPHDADTLPPNGVFICSNSNRFCVRIGYFSEGFLAIQRAVDLSIIGELGSVSSARKIDIQLKNFPYPPYVDDEFLLTADSDGSLLSLKNIIFCSFLVTLASICLDVVQEKEKKLKVWFRLCIRFLACTEYVEL